jgi:glucose-6-phosphate 1-epimerase
MDERVMGRGNDGYAADMTQLNPAPLPGVEARPGTGHYGIFDHGAHIFAWQPDGQAQPVLWLSSASEFADGKAIRGGIPICFPWFGPGFKRDRTPAHGFVRTVAWQRESTHESHDKLEVRYVIDQTTTGEQQFFSTRYQAELRARFAHDHLEVSLQVENHDDEPFTIEEALHTYLAVSDVQAISIDGLDGAAYLDKVSGDVGFDNTQSGTLRLTGPTDRVYVHGGEVTLDDPGYGRRLRLTTHGSTNVVVWNPWADGAATIADIDQSEWTGFVCVEAANAYADAVTLLPGEHWTMTQRIELEALDD